MLVGVLVDVSGSMENSLQLNKKPNDNEVTRVTSIFRAIINIAGGEVARNQQNHIFVLGFGLKDHKTVDLLHLLEKFEAKRIDQTNQNFREAQGELNALLIQYGAPHAWKYIDDYVSDVEARFICDFYSKNIEMLRDVIRCLPDACKDDTWLSGSMERTFGFLAPGIEKEKTRAEVRKAIENAKYEISRIPRDVLREVSRAKPQFKTFEAAIDLIKRAAGKSSRPDEEDFSAAELNKLVEFIEPFIYGGTPMCAALNSAIEIFHSSNSEQKIMFVLSDGGSTDDDPTRLIPALRDMNVIVLSCLLTAQSIAQGRRLVDEADSNWDESQRDMFDLSSAIENTHEAMSVLLDLGWEIPESGESRLFIQANDAEIMDEFSSIVRSMADSNDALLNICARVTLDQYINSNLSGFKPNHQIQGTCYANAVAAVMHLAMQRIVCREGGFPEFPVLCQELMDAYGMDGANIEEVLDEWIKKYRLRYEVVDVSGARRAINARRPVVATYFLYEEEWLAFNNFFATNPKGILSSTDLGTHSSQTYSTKLTGHAVVLIKCSPNTLTFMNSGGTKWGDNGFFRVEDKSVPELVFYDVFWTLDDLLPSEKQAFNEKMREVGEERLQSLPERIRNLHYKCPRCLESSPASSYKGHLQLATCPKCGKDFIPISLGLQLSSYAK